MATKKDLIIVESPTKAKTIGKFLGKEYKVVSSFGHIRDLPEKKLGVDVDNNFEPQYTIPAKAKTTVTMLKKEAAKTNQIYLATDSDREGEAIAWHLKYLLTDKKKDEQTHRITFHEITKTALQEALQNPGKINLSLVDAQQARRILDRLVGYKLSPFLWRKVAKGLSAGRVQSVVVRLIVEREREIQDFKSEEYWSIMAKLFAQEAKEQIFDSSLHKIDSKKLEKLDLKNKKQVEKIEKDLEKATYKVQSIKKRSQKRQPLAPFTTSTLQQEANKKLGFSSKQTMYLAQSLYEGVEMGDGGATGLITYMRTDSVNLSSLFVNEARDYLKQEYGDKYLPKEARKFAAKSKNAQEAHEAIRPTSINFKPAEVKKHLNKNQFRLYQLIWQRALASQMTPAQSKSTTLDIEAQGKNSQYIFRSSGSILEFDGFLKVYPASLKENILPDLKEGQNLNLDQLKSEQHFTEPPARYSEATLVKTLEELGIGRPSTYAPTISTVETRGYIRKDKNRLSPQEIAFLVNDLLVEHFPRIVDYDFTATMEEDLDKIARGEKEWVPIIKEFYEPFMKNLNNKYEEVNKKDIVNEETDEKCDKCGAPMLIKTGRYGKFMACSAFPKCRNIKPIKKNEDGEETVEEEKPVDEQTDEKCEKCGKPMVIKTGRFGKFLACSGFPQCKNTKPIDFGTGVKCPECKEGEMVARRTRSRRTFYACNRYPKCKYAVWSEPIPDEKSKDGQGLKCPKCGALLVKGAKDKIKCSSKDCNYETDMQQE